MPSLYIIATPIGNLEDITLRALRVLKEVGVIAAEDTRTTRKLLSAYSVRTPLLSYNEHNRKARIPVLLRRLEREDVALVSEAGTPGISDPGSFLVQAAIERGVAVVPLPGPSVVTAALAISGLPTESFLFLGFFPRRRTQRLRLLAGVAEEKHTLVAFEAPHRLRGFLEDALVVLGERRMAVCRELTKVYEEVFRGTVSQALDYFTEPRGEFTLVIAGAGETGEEPGEETLRQELQRLKDAGLSGKEARARVSQALHVPRRRVYQAWLKMKGS